MITVTYVGTIPTNKVYETTCSNCSSIITAAQTDLTLTAIGFDPVQRFVGDVTCPVFSWSRLYWTEVVL